jgi:hypothetical protein
MIDQSAGQSTSAETVATEILKFPRACRLQAVEGIIRTLKQRAIGLLVRERAVLFACEGDG